MGQASNGPAFLTRYMRKLRGDSQPILAEASDGYLYVVKFANNVQGLDLLFNEAMGIALYEMCGLPVASWSPLAVSDEFIADNRECWFETSAGKTRPGAGTCFGSRFLGCPEIAIHEILPGTYFQRVRNRADFWLAWLIDVCAGHVRNREAVFCAKRDGSLTAFFTDHGHMFGGPKGDGIPRMAASQYLDLRIYEGSAARSQIDWRVLLHRLKAEHLWNFALTLPAEWSNGGALSKFADFLNRLSNSQFVENISNGIMDSYGYSHASRLAYKENGTGASRILPPRIFSRKVRGGIGLRA